MADNKWKALAHVKPDESTACSSLIMEISAQAKNSEYNSNSEKIFLTRQTILRENLKLFYRFFPRN